MAYSLLIIFITLLKLSFATATPVSTSFPVPSILTPHFEDSPSYSVTPRKVGFKVASVTNYGNLHDNSINSSYTIARSFPPTLCSIQNRTFWFAGQTRIQDSHFKLIGSSITSVAIALTFSHPTWIRELSTRPESAWSSVIPLTPAEKAISLAYNQNTTFYPRIHSSLINDSSAIQFWDVKSLNSLCHSNAGTTLIIYTLDSMANTLTVTRPAPVYQKYRVQYEYGSFATLTVQGTTYLYTWDTFSTGDENYDGWHRDVHVAAAPASSIADKSTWKYYDNGTQTWSSTEPLPTQRRVTAAILTLDDIPYYDGLDFFISASIFYSKYHNAYLLVYTAIDNHLVRVRYAATPVGPWSSPGVIILDGGPYSINFATVLASPIISQTDGNVGGKSLLLTTDYPGNMTVKITFA
ncbi:hypothetical protein V1520DRAFT_315602 [Lipomyces starkeyi]|uniref:DUF4185 domain-containing protein n=1 Tax=Lipomyces starkeyi NRRL Y-11557 TaxID=675824 RepID=A0A1E3Q1T3_LIPST|nr:hypothetical protein LIPSTDRAFT_73152 [Lipomyces starkeyi NRRL Y-11557]